MKQNLRNDLTYRQVGDYLLPELGVPEAPKVGVWGNRREAYLPIQRKEFSIIPLGVVRTTRGQGFDPPMVHHEIREGIKDALSYFIFGEDGGSNN